MFRAFASGYVINKLARRIHRAAPSPILGAIGVAAASMLVTRLFAKRSARRAGGNDAASRRGRPRPANQGEPTSAVSVVSAVSSR